MFKVSDRYLLLAFKVYEVCTKFVITQRPRMYKSLKNAGQIITKTLLLNI